eukprot:scaffold4595_cov415-Prasinococcus_capsulatus_cf.AAC.3
MYRGKSFVKKTRGGKVLKVVREHYTRDDLSCGSALAAPEFRGTDASQWKLSTDVSEHAHYLVVDTNVALHQLTLLEHEAVNDVVLCSTVLQEVRKNNSAAYERLRALTNAPGRRFFVFSNEHHSKTYVGQCKLGESSNDRNDRAIRRVAQFYKEVVPQMRIILLSDDVQNRKRAVEDEQVEAMSCIQYVKSVRKDDAPGLLDVVAGVVSEGPERREHGETLDPALENERDMTLRERKKAKRTQIFADHLSESDAKVGLKSGHLLQGVVKTSRYNAYEGVALVERVGEILLPTRALMNRATDGDSVAIRLLPKAEWVAGSKAAGRIQTELEEDEAKDQSQEQASSAVDQSVAVEDKKPTGEVVRIIRRGWRQYCGSLEVRKGAKDGLTQLALFVPVERNLPKVRIATRQLATLLQQRIVVAIDSWDVWSSYPSGHYVKSIGKAGDRATETKLILLENDINESPFTEAVYRCVPPLPWTVQPEHLQEKGRRDLRHLLVCSVDPPGCRDIDDALHVKHLPNGNIEIGVHIADVTHFLKPGTPMDDEAAARGTSTYLVERRIDMLPKALTEDLCSLRSGVERLAFSVLWEVAPDTCDVVSVDFTKSVIKSVAALTYGEAQARIDTPSDTSELTENLRTLNRLAKSLRKGRLDRGALTLASPEVRFQIDTETHDPLDVGMYQVKETNHMVEEFMLLANVTVAERILLAFPSCAILRRHPVPPKERFDSLLHACKSVGVAMDVSSSKRLAESLDEATAPRVIHLQESASHNNEDPFFNRLLRILATRCMTQAVYFSSGEVGREDFVHYGLACPLYTHFTSPIRRYADVLVHRQLAAALKLNSLDGMFDDKQRVRELVNNLNYRHHNAQLAGRGSVELHTLIFFHKNPQERVESRIVKILCNGVVVHVPKYGIEHAVHLRNSDGEELREEQLEVVDDGACLRIRAGTLSAGLNGQGELRLLQKVFVSISVQEKVQHRPRLVLELQP